MSLSPCPNDQKLCSAQKVILLLFVSLACMCMGVHVCVNTCVCMHVCMLVCACMWMCVCVCMHRVCAWVCVCVHAWMGVHGCICICDVWPAAFTTITDTTMGGVIFFEQKTQKRPPC